MHKNNIVTAGAELTTNSKVLIMLHGRGASAEDILTLSGHLDVEDYTLLAPQATGNTWYPYSFMAPLFENEPWLSSALQHLAEIVKELNDQNIPSQQIYFLGFSQGACLALEFTTRNARRFGGIVAFTGGLIGDKIYRNNYKGDFEGTPVFIGSSDPDIHVPVERVHTTATILKEMGAVVSAKVYDNIGHTIIPDEIMQANRIVFS